MGKADPVPSTTLSHDPTAAADGSSLPEAVVVASRVDSRGDFVIAQAVRETDFDPLGTVTGPPRPLAPCDKPTEPSPLDEFPPAESSPEESVPEESVPEESAPEASAPGEPLDRATLATWVVHHHEALYRYAYRLAGNQADAEDLTQQTYLIASKRGAAVRDANAVAGWLMAVLRNCYLKNWRRKVPLTGCDLELELESLPAATELPAWEREEIQAALNELPDEFRPVVWMFYFEELSYKDIAQRLRVPLGTVMSRLSRGKKWLRGRLLGPTSD